MFQLIGKIFSFVITHKFSVEIGTAGVLGIAVPELAAWDHVTKIVVGILTIFFICRKEYRDRKKKQNADF